QLTRRRRKSRRATLSPTRHARRAHWPRVFQCAWGKIVEFETWKEHDAASEAAARKVSGLRQTVAWPSPFGFGLSVKKRAASPPSEEPSGKEVGDVVESTDSRRR